MLWLVKGLGRGGAEQLLVSTAGHIDRRRFAVEVAYVLPWKDALVEPLEARGVPAHCLGGGRAFDVRWVARLRRLVRSRPFDLVHAHLPFAALGARLALGPGGPPVVYTEHNVWERYRPAMRWANALTYRRNAAVIAVSDAVQASVRAHENAFVRVPSIETVVHGVDLDETHHGADAARRARRVLGLGPDELVIGTVANFTPKKDQHTLLAAVALLPRSLPWRLVLVGSGPLEVSLRAAVDELGLGHRVMFAGSRDDVPEILPAFDVFVLSSRYEGLPISLLEAMAAGVPVVATAVGGIPDAVADGVTGVLLPPGDPGVLADALGGVLGDSDRRVRMGAAAREAAERFSILPAVRTIEQIYERVLPC